MSDGRERFVLYEYLMFFWKKKWLVVALPLLGIVAGLAIGLVKETPYVGNLPYYTGEVTKPDLVIKELIKNNLPEEISDKVDIVPGQNMVTFVSHSADQEEIKEIFTRIEKDYGKRLEDNSDVQLKKLNDNLAKRKEQENNLDEMINNYSEEIENTGLDKDTKRGNSIQPLYKKFLDLTQEIYQLDDKVSNFTKAQRLDSMIVKEKTNTTSNILVGFIIGLFLSLCLVTLWKYILDARRGY
ncbi:hypothetical protein J1P26_24680 [Neobacillus sp. MM2021_6]|uniref:hypothetical protein n=1 Tax=Bacillaceae TaxID=186817 RepID=UPI00140DFDAE|nr:MULTISPECIES: hypothetical protein [Bacillaceae]MBO0962872.1 hypothetical protein [Neobacillus sp. MM2021_6]NHC19608.1 hypothetical protein [Bacillus sp. MM2020_4]